MRSQSDRLTEAGNAQLRKHYCQQMGCKHIFTNSAFNNCFARHSFLCGGNAGLLWDRGFTRGA